MKEGLRLFDGNRRLFIRVLLLCLLHFQVYLTFPITFHGWPCLVDATLQICIVTHDVIRLHNEGEEELT